MKPLKGRLSLLNLKNFQALVALAVAVPVLLMGYSENPASSEYANGVESLNTLGSQNATSSLEAPALTSTYQGNQSINLYWNDVSGATSYVLERINTGERGVLNDGENYVGNETSAEDHPYRYPTYDSFVPGEFGFACYRVKAVNSATESEYSNAECYGTSNSGF